MGRYKSDEPKGAGQSWHWVFQPGDFPELVQQVQTNGSFTFSLKSGEGGRDQVDRKVRGDVGCELEPGR